jgi:hypothetical protein
MMKTPSGVLVSCASVFGRVTSTISMNKLEDAAGDGAGGALQGST